MDENIDSSSENIIDYITFTDVKMFCDIWFRSKLKTDDNSIYSNSVFTFKLGIHDSYSAYVCVIRSSANVLTFLIERPMVDDSFIPESILADLICRQLRKI